MGAGYDGKRLVFHRRLSPTARLRVPYSKGDGTCAAAAAVGRAMTKKSRSVEIRMATMERDCECSAEAAPPSSAQFCDAPRA